MGNMYCPAQDAAHLAAVARDFCPFPDYTPAPLLVNMMSVNASLHLGNHYATVQASLTPQQQQAFTQTLRSTFGREGIVTNGRVGIVALSLAVLFDTVATKVKGGYVSDQGPIPGLFLQDPRGYYDPQVYTISKYLRLVPHMANNPTRMRDETKRYLMELHSARSPAAVNSTVPKDEEITEVNMWMCNIMQKSMKAHFEHIANETLDLGKKVNQNLYEETPAAKYILNLNCDVKKASERFVDELNTLDDRTKEAFKNCKLDRDTHMFSTAIENIALLNLVDTITMTLFRSRLHTMYARAKDFDLKANALGKWN